MSHQDRRAAIVSAAIRLFSQKGFNGTTTRELASAIGVTEPVLYQHFENKQQLYRAIIDSLLRQRPRRLARLLKPFALANDDRGFFRTLAEAIYGGYQKDPAFVRLMFFSALEGHELAEQFYRQRIYRLYFRVILPYIRKRIRDGAMRELEPTVIARSFAGMAHFQALMDVLFEDRFVKTDPRRFLEGMVDIFLQGVSMERRGTR